MACKRSLVWLHDAQAGTSLRVAADRSTHCALLSNKQSRAMHPPGRRSLKGPLVQTSGTEGNSGACTTGKNGGVAGRPARCGRG